MKKTFHLQLQIDCYIKSYNFMVYACCDFVQAKQCAYLLICTYYGFMSIAVCIQKGE